MLLRLCVEVFFGRNCLKYSIPGKSETRGCVRFRKIVANTDDGKFLKRLLQSFKYFRAKKVKIKSIDELLLFFLFFLSSFFGCFSFRAKLSIVINCLSLCLNVSI